MPGSFEGRWVARFFVLIVCLWVAQLVPVAGGVALASPEEAGVHHADMGAAVHGEVAGEEAHAAGGHGGGEGHGGEGHHGGVTHTQLMNFVWHCLNFSLLVVLLVKFLKRPLTESLKGRQEQVAAAFEELKASKAEAERKYAEYERKLANMEEEADRILKAFIEQGKAEKEKIIAQAHESAERIKAQAELFIQQELVKAKRELQQEVAEMAVQMAEEIIRKNITEDDHKKLIEDYLQKVEAKS